MRRLPLQLSILLVTVQAAASPPPRFARLPVTAAENVREEADTLFLFAESGAGAFGAPGTDARGYTFNGGYDGNPAGWIGVNLSVPPDHGWQLADAHMTDGHATDMSQALPFDPLDTVNDHALWCGNAGEDEWAHSPGYGNFWLEWIRVDTQAAYHDSITIRFAYAADFEGGEQDYFTIQANAYNGYGNRVPEIFRNDLPHERTFQEVEFTVRATDVGMVYFRNGIDIRFRSNYLGSDQDGVGAFPSDIGAVWLDNLEIECDGALVFRADFEDGLLPPGVRLESDSEGEMDAGLWENLFHEDRCVENVSPAWAFFGCWSGGTYPLPVICYGPPYFHNAIESPALTRSHEAGIPFGQPLDLEPDQTVHLDYWLYRELPLNTLVFTRWQVAAVTASGQGPWVGDDVYYYGNEKRWLEMSHDATAALLASANGEAIEGVAARLHMVDMCEQWCGIHGDGTGHNHTPYMDNVRVKLVGDASGAWAAAEASRFQDGFAPAGGTLRIDAARNIEPAGSPVAVAGDSTVVNLSMPAHGGLAASFNAAAGELRPALHLWWRVTDGPHAGLLDAAMADPDAADGIWSPYAGTQVFDGELWGVMQADSAAWQGETATGFAFDFADEHFEPGDVLEYFFRAEAVDGHVETRPATAMSGDPALRERHVLRCLPTAGAELLLVAAAGGEPLPWREAFVYNGYQAYDVYTLLAPGEGLENGPARSASAAELEQYRVIVWDAGNVDAFTLGEAPDDKALDTDLLADWLAGSDHDAGLWLLGDGVARDLGIGSPFLETALGVDLLVEDTSYEELTDLLSPRVRAVHPELAYLGGEPEVWVHGGCPVLPAIDLVAPVDTLAEATHLWEDDGALGIAAGILNLDPEGDGTALNDLGHASRTLFNPFGYARVRDLGYGLPVGVDYARLMVGHVLDRLFGLAGGPVVPANELPPARTALTAAWPNPFNPATTVAFSLAEPGPVTLRVYDLAGRRLLTLLDESREAGQHEVVWNGRDAQGRSLASGVFFVRMEAREFVGSRRVLLLK